MPGKRISELTALSGANSANNDDVIIFDTTANETKRISRSQLAEGLTPDLPLQYYLGVLNSNPTQRLNGNALMLGDYYLDAVTKYTTIYNGSGWNSYASVIAVQTASEAARDKAQEWATNPENDPVETGQYSALHWSAKAEDEKLAAQAARTAAETAETNAELAEVNAEAARDAAIVAKTAAELAETNAETARDVAFVNANVYADTTAGLAAVALSGQFQVVSGEDIIRYREDAGPVATEVARYPSASKVATSIARSVPWLKVLTRADGSYLVPVVQYEMALGLVWVNGRVRTVAAAMTNHGDGSYTLNEVPSGLATGVSVYFEWSTVGHTGTASGTYVSLVADTASLGGEVGVYAAYDFGGSNTLGFVTSNRNPPTTEQVRRARWGTTRGIIVVPSNGSASKCATEDQDIFVGNVSTVYSPALAMSIQRRPLVASPATLANATVPRVIVYPAALTNAEIDSVFANTDPDPVTVPTSFPQWLAVIDSGNGNKVVPSFQFDPTRNRCWYRGRERSIADVLTANVDGTWTMKKPPYGLRTTTGITVIGDVRPNDYYTYAAPVSGTVFHCSSAVSSPAGLQDRLQVAVSNGGGSVDPGGLLNPSGYSSAVANNFSCVGPLLGVVRGQGIFRLGVSARTVGKYMVSSNVDGISETAGSATAYAPQDYFRFGALYNGTQVLTNATLEQIIIYSQTLTSDQLQKAMEFNEYGLPPMWFVGDSINNVAQPAEMLRMHFANRGATYIPIVSGGQGARGLSFFEEYIESILAARDYMRDYMLVLVEGGFDYTSRNLADTATVGPYSEKDIQTYLYNIFSKFRQPKKVFMESNSNLTAEGDIAAGNTTGMTKLRNTMKNIRETYPAFFCATMPLMQAPALTSAEYTAIRTDGRVATHLRGDGIHFPWGTAYSGADSGYFWWSLALMNHLQSIGYDPAKPLNG